MLSTAIFQRLTLSPASGIEQVDAFFNGPAWIHVPCSFFRNRQSVKCCRHSLSGNKHPYITKYGVWWCYILCTVYCTATGKAIALKSVLKFFHETYTMLYSHKIPWKAFRINTKILKIHNILWGDCVLSCEVRFMRTQLT